MIKTILEKCYRCGEKEDIEFMFSLPPGYMCQYCADDMGVTRNIIEA